MSDEGTLVAGEEDAELSDRHVRTLQVANKESLRIPFASSATKDVRGNMESMLHYGDISEHHKPPW